MKKIFLTIIATAFVVPVFSQVIIGVDDGITGEDTESVLMDFKRDDERGIILPYVETLPTSPTPGSILLDVSVDDGEKAEVKFYNGGSNSWESLSKPGGADVSDYLDIQDELDENGNVNDVIIGDIDTDATNGVLVMESSDKAFVLPQVNSVMDISSPSPGMMVYVSSKDLLAVFDGETWAFWKAEE